MCRAWLGRVMASAVDNCTEIKINGAIIAWYSHHPHAGHEHGLTPQQIKTDQIKIALGGSRTISVFWVDTRIAERIEKRVNWGQRSYQPISGRVSLESCSHLTGFLYFFQVFTRSWNFQRHVLIHSGQKPFKCQKCPKAFALAAHLKIHNRIHTGKRKIVSYENDSVARWKSNKENSWYSCSAPGTRGNPEPHEPCYWWSTPVRIQNLWWLGAEASLGVLISVPVLPASTSWKRS